jgi:hypothetical protein
MIRTLEAKHVKEIEESRIKMEELFPTTPKFSVEFLNMKKI